MGTGVAYALITFLIGALLLLAWLYATAANPRSGAMLRKSLLLFVLPVLFWPGGLVRAYIGMCAVVACEEALKAFASTREQRPFDRFWFVTLFGIWEMVLDKSALGLILGREVATWTGLQIAGFLYATALPALMHTITAAIYAFAFKGRLWAAFVASWTIHFVFNESVGWFGVSPAAEFVGTGILVILLCALLQHAWAQGTTRSAGT